jgi:hypothetical protein
MEVNRVISKYDKESEELVGEVNIDDIDFLLLKKIFNPPAEDHLMYNPYEIGEKERIEIGRLKSIKFEPDKYDYYLECFQAEA